MLKTQKPVKPLKKYLCAAFAFLVVLLPQLSKAQSVLDKKISYKANQITLKQVLTEIGEKYEISFSYSESLIPVSQIVTINITDKPLEEVLKELLPSSVDFKEINGRGRASLV